MKPLLTLLLLTAIITGIEWGLLMLVTKEATGAPIATRKTREQMYPHDMRLRRYTVVGSDNRVYLLKDSKRNRHGDGRRSW